MLAIVLVIGDGGAISRCDTLGPPFNRSTCSKPAWMSESQPQIERYTRLLAEVEPLERDWAAMLQLSLSDRQVDRQPFDQVAFERVTEQMEKLDRELVEPEEALPDDLPDVEAETPPSRRSA